MSSSPRPLAVLLSCSIVLLSACSTSYTPAVAPAAGEGVLTVATYNVNFGLGGDPRGLAAIRATGADIVLVQESTPAWQEAFAVELAAVYPHQESIGSTWPAGGMTILSRYPLGDLAQAPSPLGWFPAWRAVAATPLGSVQLLGLHLKPPYRHDSVVYGLLTASGEHAREVAAALTLRRPDLPTIAAGDLNEESGGGLGGLAAAGLADATCGLPAGATTWSWVVAGVRLRQRLDHITHDGRLRCLEVEVLAVGASDHLPLVARFGLEAD